MIDRRKESKELVRVASQETQKSRLAESGVVFVGSKPGEPVHESRRIRRFNIFSVPWGGGKEKRSSPDQAEPGVNPEPVKLNEAKSTNISDASKWMRAHETRKGKKDQSGINSMDVFQEHTPTNSQGKPSQEEEISNLEGKVVALQSVRSQNFQSPGPDAA